MKTVFAIADAVLSYIVAVNFGIWCGIATFLILFIICRKFLSQ